MSNMYANKAISCNVRTTRYGYALRNVCSYFDEYVLTCNPFGKSAIDCTGAMIAPLTADGCPTPRSLALTTAVDVSSCVSKRTQSITLHQDNSSKEQCRPNAQVTHSLRGEIGRA